MRRLRHSPAACIAMLALFISLGGTTYAVTAVPRASVGTPQLRPRAVTEDKLANDAVVTRKLANGAVRGAKIAPASITGSRIAPDALGGGQVDEATLAPVPKAEESQRAVLATRATVADRVERIDRVARADSAAMADRATHADHAERTDRTGIADALAAVDTNVGEAVIEAGGLEFIEVDCDSGLTPIGGGAVQLGPSGLAEILQSAPVANGWEVRVYNLSATVPVTVRAFAICIRAGRT